MSFAVLASSQCVRARVCVCWTFQKKKTKTLSDLNSKDTAY